MKTGFSFRAMLSAVRRTLERCSGNRIKLEDFQGSEDLSAKYDAGNPDG